MKMTSSVDAFCFTLYLTEKMSFSAFSQGFTVVPSLTVAITVSWHAGGTISQTSYSRLLWLEASHCLKRIHIRDTSALIGNNGFRYVSQ